MSAGATPTAEAPIAAFLRGINVGGRRRVPMADLREAVSHAGFAQPRTYLQSGNLVVHPPADRADPARALEQLIADRFGFDVAVVCRTHQQLGEVVASNPWPELAADPTKLHVAFLDRAPAADRLADLDPDRSPPDRFLVRGDHIYLHYPEGSGRSKLTGVYLERVLGRTVTARNWRTVVEVAGMLAG